MFSSVEEIHFNLIELKITECRTRYHSLNLPTPHLSPVKPGISLPSKLR